MRSIVASGALAVLLAAGTAAADDKAEALFKQGKKFLAEKKYAEACAAFEKSNKLDPGIGAILNIAHCYEEWNKLATAYRRYREAEKLATDSKDTRLPKIHERVQAIEAQVPRLTVKLPAGGDSTGLSVTLDGSPLELGQLGEPQLVDPGPHAVDYKVGGDKKGKVVALERGGSFEVVLEVPKKKAKPDDKPVEPKLETHEVVTAKPAPQDPGSSRRLIAYGVGGAGIVAIGISSYMTLSARSSYNDALAQHCGGSKSMCDSDGLTITHDARSEANVATVVFAVGAAAVAGGVVLYVTAPKASTEHAMRVVPVVGKDGGQLVLSGSF